MSKACLKGRIRIGAACAALTLASLAAPMAAQASSAAELYFDRTVMSAADARCGLFSPEIGATLNAARAQARGAALRAGVDNEVLRQTAMRAQAKAGGVACNSKDLTTAAARVRVAFDGFSHMLRMVYPGDVASWRADRTLPIDGPAWRLSQTTALAGGGSMTFGMAGQRGQAPRLLAMTDLGGGPSPYAARLVVRDPNRAPEPYLGALLVSSTARLPLQSRVPPRFAAQVFAAVTREPADFRLLAPGSKSAIAFSFPSAAMDAIAGLDPREAVTVELVFPGRSGDVVRQAYVEVGDFAAGTAFLNLARR